MSSQSPSTADRLPVGSIVTIDDRRCPGFYKITGYGPKNATLAPVNPDGTPRPARGARMPGYMLHKADPNAPVTATNHGVLGDLGIYGTPRVSYPHRYVGEVVESSQHPGLWVVLADKVEKVNIAKLGGDNDRYYRAHPSTLTPVALADVASKLGA